jgi:predicted nuclease of predicted toxin-antitoxin system
VRFLIDECLSVDLVTVAGESGHEAQHVAHVGRAGWKDWNVVRYARDGDFVLVTNYASDFRQLYAAQPLHAGLVILIPVVSRDIQRRLFKAALYELAVIWEPVNRALEVDLDGDEVTLTLYDGRQLFRMEEGRRPQAAIRDPTQGRWANGARRIVGDVALPPVRRTRAQLRDRHHRAEQTLRPAPQPDARGPRARGLAGMASARNRRTRRRSRHFWPPTIPMA